MLLRTPLLLARLPPLPGLCLRLLTPLLLLLLVRVAPRLLGLLLLLVRVAHCC